MAEDHAQIVALVESVNRAWLEGRYAEIGRYVHEEVMIAPPGVPAVRGREAFVQSYADFGAAATIHAFEPEAVQVDCWGATAVAQCPYVIDYEIPSGRYKERGTDLLVLSRTDSGWQICWRTLSSSAIDEPA
jgi:Domain of unknown function (DUF4440)